MPDEQKMHQAVSSAGRAAQSTTDRVAKAAHQAVDSLTGYGARTEERLRETSRIAGKRGREYADHVSGYVNEYAGAQHILPALAPHLFPENFNRRGSPRVTIGIPVSYRFGNTIAAALTLNIGKGGVAIRTMSPLAAGERLTLRFRMPGQRREVEAEGRIAWSDRKVGMGVQFDRVDASDQAVIDDFVDQHFFSNRKA